MRALSLTSLPAVILTALSAVGCGSSATLEDAVVLGVSERLALGGEHSCAIRSDGSLKCWGKNNHNELNVATTGMCGADASVECALVPVTVPNAKPVQVAAGWDHTCILSASAKITCWGFPKYGQTGEPHEADSTAPRASTLERVIQISAAEEETCAVLDDGTARCFGFGHRGQLGDGVTEGVEAHSHEPVQVVGLTGAVAIDTGGWHACAVLDDATLQCWGDGSKGQLGYSPSDSCGGEHIGPIGPCSLTPGPVPGISGVIQVALGADHTCALLNDKTVACWGRNSSGQLGDGTTVDRTEPAPVAGLKDVVQIAAGALHTCALLEDGSVWCWGDADEAQIGFAAAETCPSGQCSSVPKQIQGISGAVEIALGDWHGCARVKGEDIVCWGRNRYGQLGDNTTESRTAPALVVWTSP